MLFRQIALISVVAFIFLGVGKNPDRPAAIKSKKTVRDVPPFLKTEEKWVDSVFKSLTPDERLGQLFMIPCYSNRDMVHVREVREAIQRYKIGGLIFMQGGPVRQAKLTNYFQNLSKTPLMISIDGEWGLAMRLDSTPQFPRQMTLGAIQNDSLIYWMGKEIANECKRIGINVNFAPVADVNNNPNNPVIGMRSFGEDKFNVARKASMYMSGMQDYGVLANGKHFPGHGDTDKDSHKTLPSILHGTGRLDSLELYPFRYLFERGLSSVMVAHLFIPAYDSTKNQASTLSKKVVTDLLKNRLGFQGLVFTDALNMKGASAYNAPGAIDAKALLAGNDVLLFSENLNEAFSAIKLALGNNEITQEEIDIRCKKILQAKFWLGLSQNKSIKIKGIYNELNNSMQKALRAKLAEASVTLLRNNNSILPLKLADTLKIATLTIGSSEQNVFNEFVSRYAPVNHFGITHHAGSAARSAITEKLKQYDLILVQVNNTSMKPDNNFGFTSESDAMLQEILKNKKAIVSFLSNPYLLNRIKNLDKAEAVIMGYEDNDFTQKAAAEAIFGAIKVNGKLPVSSGIFPLNTGIETASPVRIQYVNPEQMGIQKKKLDQIDSLAKKGISDKCYPGCRILALKDGKVFYDKSFGNYRYGQSEKVDYHTIYDLASVTKISATALALMRLHGEGKLDVTKKFGDYLPECYGTNKSDLTLCEVMTHQAGLPAWIPFYKKSLTEKGVYRSGYYSENFSEEFPFRVRDGMYVTKTIRDSIINQILKCELKHRGKYLYSDLGYYLHQRIIERLTHQTLDSFLLKNFYLRMGLQTIGYRPYKKFSSGLIAPTENDQEFRRTVLCGDVHDQGAALLGGVAGHAGLFSNANDLAVVMQMLLNKGKYGGDQFLDSNSVKLFAWKNYFPENRRGLCFEKPEPNRNKNGPVTEECSLESFGHSGFTGTFVWADPKNQLVYIFLSNRVYPDAGSNKLFASGIRPKIHKLLYEAVADLKPPFGN